MAASRWEREEDDAPMVVVRAHPREGTAGVRQHLRLTVRDWNDLGQLKLSADVSATTFARIKRLVEEQD